MNYFAYQVARIRRISHRFAFAVAGLLALPALPATADSALDAIKGGRPFGAVRVRHEAVDSAQFPRDGSAHTVRAAAGFETRAWRGWNALVELEAVRAFRRAAFDDGVKGRNTFPLVADPNGLELNQGYVGYAGISDTVVRVGRQALSFANQRHLGPGAFRQNHQTFDAVSIDNRSFDDLLLTYGYVFKVHRFLGDDSPVGNLDSRSHVLNLTYTGIPRLSVSAHGYLLDIPTIRRFSTQTYGIRADAAVPFRYHPAWRLLLRGEVSVQRDFASSRSDYSATYVSLEPGIQYHDLTFTVGLDVLGSNGRDAFITPLGTLHAFNGLTDNFATTPTDGLVDRYAKVSYRIRQVAFLDALELSAAFHSFITEQDRRTLGTEWNAQIAGEVNRHLRVSLEHAQFAGRAPLVDVSKTWASATLRY